MTNDLQLYASIARAVDYDGAVDMMLANLSEQSRRVYAATFRAWGDYCEAHGLPLFALTQDNVRDWLYTSDIGHETRLQRVAHLRSMLEHLRAIDVQHPGIEKLYRQMKLLKLQRSEEEKQAERVKVALTREEVHRALNVWHDDSHKHRRNRAIMSVLLYAGLRRSECARLQWQHIDADERVLHVIGGKGDKNATIPLLSETLVQSLHRWRECIDGYAFCFPRLHRGDTIGKDKPITGKSVYRVVKATADRVDLDMTPHDARRTLITRLLEAGTTLADTQLIARHEKPETTQKYNMNKDARYLGDRAKLDY